MLILFHDGGGLFAQLSQLLDDHALDDGKLALPEFPVLG